MTIETVYDIEDIVWLSRSLSVRHLMMPRAALHTLERHVTELEALPPGGVASEDTPAEALITADGYLQCLGAYDTDLRDDLLLRCAPLQLATLGGLMTILSPQLGDAMILQQAQSGGGARSWLVGLALSHATNAPAGEFSAHLALIEQVRALLIDLPRPSPRLWRTADVPRAGLEALQTEMREIYREHGADAAHAHLTRLTESPESGPLGQFLKDRSARRG